MMKNLFYLIIRIRLHILWYSKMHCRRGERWHNGEQGRYSERGGENKIQGMKMEQQKQQKASEKIFLGLIKSKRQNNKSKSKIISVSCDQSTPQQTNKWEVSVLFLRNNFYVPTESQAIEQSTMSMCGCMCTLWGLMTGTGFNTNKRHKQQAVISGPNELQWLLSMSGNFLYFSFIYMWMIWYGLKGWTVQTWCSYLLVGWQCDIQITYGSLWKAFAGFWLSQEGEAAAWLLAHISDLQKTAQHTASQVDWNKLFQYPLGGCEGKKLFFLRRNLYFFSTSSNCMLIKLLSGRISSVSRHSS